VDDDREIDNASPDPAAEEPPENGSPVEEPEDEGTAEVEEAGNGPEEIVYEPGAGLSLDAGEENAASPAVQQFVDFDVWIATLEANFGQDFEQVLYDSLGPDWNMQINNKMASGENFSEVVQEIKKEAAGGGEQGLELDEENISFEALGSDEGGGGPGGGGGGPGGGGGGGGGAAGTPDSIPLADLQRKEFISQDKFKLETRPEDYRYEKVLRYRGDKDGQDGDDEVVLVDRSDFTRLSYFAQKEKERHQDDLSLEEVLKRDRQERMREHKRSHMLLLTATGVFLLYILFCVVSYLACGIYSHSLLGSRPPDLVFRPSTELHKQGELVSYDSAEDGKKRPLVLYTLRPTLKKLDLTVIGSGGEQQFELSVCEPTIIVIPSGPGQDSITVRKHYYQGSPSNLGGILRQPFISLIEGDTRVLQVFETFSSSLLPGLMQLEIYDGQDLPFGWAYVAGEQLNIILEPGRKASAGQLQVWKLRLVLLFSVLKI